MEHGEMGGGLEVLEADLAELENSVYHLVRSNVELAEFLREEPEDEDLQQAIDENKAVLVKKRHRVKALRNAISDLKSQHPHFGAAAVAPSTPVLAPPTLPGGVTASDSVGTRWSAGAVGADGSSGPETRAEAASGTHRTSAEGRNGNDGGLSDAISATVASIRLDAETLPPETTPTGIDAMAGSHPESGNTSAASCARVPRGDRTADGVGAGQDAEAAAGGGGGGVDQEGVLL